MEGKYEYIKIKPAENGWVLCYDECYKNPMESDSTFGYSEKYIEKKEVFEAGTGEGAMEAALGKALDRQKELLLANREMMLAHAKSMMSGNSHNSHNSEY